jgi:CRISPR-associated endonuclease Csn1
MENKYRLGLDLGANSIGWCLLRLDECGLPCGILDIGVRVYPDGRDPKKNSSLAAERRGARSMRRNRDRYLQRRRKLLNALIRFGFMPADTDAQRIVVQSNEPYKLRGEALHRALDPFELGRVFFQLNQSRGFKSNRKIDRNDADGGLIKDAVARTEATLRQNGFLTIGAWLADRHAKRLDVRVRLAGTGKTKEYPFYPARAMVEAEFSHIWAAQAEPIKNLV